MPQTKVAVLRVTPGSVLSDVERLSELAGMTEALGRDVPTLVRPNALQHYPLPSANTTPWQLQGTLTALQHAGYPSITCIQSRTTVGQTLKGFDLNRFLTVCRRLNVPVRYNFMGDDMAWVPYRPKAKLRVLHKLFPEGLLIPDYFVGKNMVQLPTARCHPRAQIAGATLSAWNPLLGKQVHRAEPQIHRALVDLLAIQKEIHPGLFAVMDATTAGNGQGQRGLMPVVKNMVLASRDPIALDAVAAQMMGFDPLSIEFIKLAHDDGLGVGDPREIEIVGSDVARENWGFQPGLGTLGRVGEALRGGHLSPLRRLVYRTPLVKAITLGQALYEDHYRWPHHDKQVFEQWRQSTPWGQLFARYEGDEPGSPHTNAETATP